VGYHETSAECAIAGYTEDLNLEDTLTARCAFAIENLLRKANDVVSSEILGSQFARIQECDLRNGFRG
jgi:hypothetical protein